MSKSKLNFIIDALMFQVMMVMISIGLMMKYILISGSERWIKYGTNPDLKLLGMDRHDWGYLHLILGYILIGLLILHIILHWKTIVCLFKKIIKNFALRLTTGIIFLLLSLIILIAPFILDIEISPMGNGTRSLQKNSSVNLRENNRRNMRESEGRGLNRDNRANRNRSDENRSHRGNHQEDHKYYYKGQEIIIKGFMTLKEISERYDIPGNYLKKKLDLSSTTSDNERLGSLRRIYGFNMNEIELIIHQYHELKSNKE